MDFIPVETVGGGQGYLAAPGGSPLNTAISISRLGVEAGFLGKLSTDFFGDEFKAWLDHNRVATTYVTRAEAPSTLAFVKRDRSGDAQYAFFTAATADGLLAESDLPAELPASVECLQFGSISLAMAPACETITRLVLRERGKRVLSFDPNIRPGLISDSGGYRERFARLAEAATVLKLSDADLGWLYPGVTFEHAVVRAGGLGPPLVVVTRGAEGVIGICPRGSVQVAAVQPPGGVADTVGAGDSFHGALLASLQRLGKLTLAAIAELSRSDLEQVLRFAVRVAAITCSRPGADPPWIAELE